MLVSTTPSGLALRYRPTMLRFVVNMCVYVVAAAVGLIVADAVLADMSVSYPTGFLTAVLVFALIQALVAPLLQQVTERNAALLTGGVGLFSALVALIVTVAVTDGLSITGLTTWIAAAVIIWLASMIAGFILSLTVAKKIVKEVRD